MKFYISFKDSRDNIFRTIRVWTTEVDLESVMRQFATNSFSKEFVESIKFESEDRVYVLSLFGPNQMELGWVVAEAA